MRLYLLKWSSIDQAIVSLGTFLANVLLARHLTLSEYGIYALLLSAGSFAQLVNFWLSGYPLAIRLASAGGDEGAKLSSSSLLLVACFCVPLSTVIVLTLLALGRPELIPAALMWFFFCQIQQATRRALLADLRYRKAIIGDIAASLGPVVLLSLISTRHPLSLNDALYCFSAAAILGAALQILQMRVVIRNVYPPHRMLLENAWLGAWSLGAAAIWQLNGPILFGLVATLSGTASVAMLQAAINIFSVLNPVYATLGNLIPQITARALDRENKRTAWNAVRFYVLIALPPTLVYVVFVPFFSSFLLWAFYGNDSHYLTLGALFPALAIGTAAVVPAELINFYLLGLKQPQQVLKINLLGFLSGAISIPPLFALVGVLQGSCIALAVIGVVRLTISLIVLRNSLKPEPSKPQLRSGRLVFSKAN
jgi:O-antigen/teichoic acid export membrane protein